MTKTAQELLEDFNKFDRDNPEVYKKLVDLAYEAKRRGKTKLSIEMLYNVLRWYTFLNTKDDASDYKLSNNHKAFYARKIMAENPDLDGFFSTKTSKGEWVQHHLTEAENKQNEAKAISWLNDED